MTVSPQNIIAEAKDVSFSYPDGQDRYVLNKLNLQVFRGECVAILGESGAGKTTLLKLLCGLLKPGQGQILFEGKPLQGPRKDIVLIFQNYGLFPWKTVRENILLPARLGRKRAKNLVDTRFSALRGLCRETSQTSSDRVGESSSGLSPRVAALMSGMSEKVDANELAKLLDYLGLREFAHRFPAELSGGQLQRTALGRAVMSGASLLLMDEPFSALDLRNRARLQSFMKTFLEDTGMSSVIVTHSIEEALCMGDRVAVFDPERGTIRKVWEGCRQETDPNSAVLNERSRRIREFLLQVQEAGCRSDEWKARTTDNGEQ